METFFPSEEHKRRYFGEKKYLFFFVDTDCITLVCTSTSLFFQKLLRLFCLLKCSDTPNNNKEIAATKADCVQGFSRVKNGLWWRLTNAVIQTHSTKYPTIVQCVPNTDNKSKINSKKQFVTTLCFVLNVL